MRGDDVRLRARSIITLACAMALGGCAQQLSSITEARETGWFSKPVDLFRKPEWATVGSNTAELSPSGPVAAEDLVSADGQCAATSAQAAAVQPAAAPVQASASGAGFEGGLHPGPGAGLAAPSVTGAIGLGMTECQAVRRAGGPSHVAISAGDNGERRVVLTYLSGPWPGIYTFDGGRLKMVDGAPVQERKPEPKKKPVKRLKTAAKPNASGAAQSSSPWPQR
jgi:hypothetical protein